MKRSLSISVFVSSKRARAEAKIKKFVLGRRSMSKYRQASAGKPELKFCDGTINVNTTNTGAAQLLTVIAQGSDNTERIGRKITTTSLQYDLLYENNTTDLNGTAGWPESAAVCKVAFVYDKQPNGALAAWSDVFNSTGNLVSPFCFKNYNNIDRFDILAIEEFTISVSGPNGERKSRFVPLKLETRFDGTTNGIADVQSGALIVVFADSNSANSQTSTLIGRTRLLYSDD